MSDGATSIKQRRRLFISYRHVEPDRTVARQVANALTELHDVFIDEGIPPGRDWGEHIESALQTAEFVIAFLSEPAARSDMIVEEIHRAHRRRMETGRPMIIPVRLGFDGQLRMPLSAYLNRFQHLFWKGAEDTPQLIHQLIEAVAERPTRLPGVFTPVRSADESATRRNRLEMINRVRFFWIDGVLRRSLYEVGRLELGLIERSDAVELPWEMMVQRPYDRPNPLPRGTKVSSVFDDHLGQLLILGAAGSGKTTLLLELTQELLNRAEEHESMPLPVVFHLSSWAVNQRPLQDWLADEMYERYGIDQEIARAWSSQGQILPLLDGLDEVALEYREKCVEAINAFRKDQGSLPIAVCSRIVEYETLTLRLRLPAAVLIQPLTPQRVREYLDRAGEPLEIVRAAMRAYTGLSELLDTPLMLSVAVLAFRDQGSAEIQIAGTLAERRDHLFAKYVDAMFHRRSVETCYTQDKTIRWLGWLSSGMARLSQSVFHVDGLDLNWLSTRAEQRIAGFALGVVFGILYALLFALHLGLAHKPGERLVASAPETLIVLFIPVGFGLLGWRSRWHLQPRVFRWSWPAMRMGRARSFVRSFAIVGTIFGLVVGLILTPNPGPPFALEVMLIVVLLSGLFGAVFFGLIGLVYAVAEASITVKTYKISMSASPNQGTWNSARNAMVSGLFFCLVFGLPLGLVAGRFLGVRAGLDAGLVFGLWCGLYFAFSGGGAFCVRHLIIRLLLWRRDFTPREYVRFLDYAAERLFLRKVGGGYIFVHRMLMEYFAAIADQDVAEYRHAPVLKPDDAYAILNLGNALAEKGEYNDAIAEYRRALLLKPQNADAHNGLGVALRRIGKRDEAILEFGKAIKLNPRNFLAHINLGLALHDEGHYEEAIAACKKGIYLSRKALVRRPNWAIAVVALAIALAKIGQFDEAIAEYRKALALESDDPGANNGLGYLLAELGRFDEAMPYIKKALQLRPEDPSILDSLGFVLAGKGQYEAAICKYREALRTQPESANFHYHLAQALEKLGCRQEADQEFAVAHQLAPGLHCPSD